MRWRKLNNYTSESDMGYRVTKSLVKGAPVYAAWHPTPSGFAPLGTAGKPEQAARICVEHSQTEKHRQA